jgi:hypothetical protein
MTHPQTFVVVLRSRMVHRPRVWCTLAALMALAVVGGCRRGDGAATGPWNLSQVTGRVTLPARTTLSVARLASSGAPDNCADVTWEAAQEIDHDRLRARGFVVLASTCAQTFAPKVTPLASCARAEAEDGSHPLGHGQASYYDLATLAGDDTYRGQCLGTGGDWKLSPDFEARKARTGGDQPPHHEIDSLMELLP